jgi:putative acetyltransferase
MSLVIRPERETDIPVIRDVNDRAFGQSLEGRIVDALRSNDAATLSLVAVIDDRVVGHLMYSPVDVGVTRGAALGPMSVLPEHQRTGIGAQLIAEGSRRLTAAGLPFVIVLGHHDYYPRFGFVPASRYAITCDWDVPEEAFMIQVLDPARMPAVTGRAQYRGEFSME